MKRILICDSGIGGLNIAARFFRPGATGEDAEILYFNAYPTVNKGFNAIENPRDQEDLFRIVLEAMTPFSPDVCLIACNTLSIIAQRLMRYYKAAFPVQGILDPATEKMASALRGNETFPLLLLGTKTTMDSGFYPQQLIRQGVDKSRIFSLAVPGLATQLESGIDTPEVAKTIAVCAGQAKELLPPGTEKLYLGLCCTHFGFASRIWEREFSAVFKVKPTLLDPDQWFGGNAAGKKFQYVSRIPFFGDGQKTMMQFFSGSAPEISNALATAQSDPGLFQVPEKFFDKQ